MMINKTLHGKLKIEQHERTIEQHEWSIEQHEWSIEQHEWSIEQHEWSIEQHERSIPESFCHSLKTELVHHCDFATRAEAKQEIFEYKKREVISHSLKFFDKVRRFTPFSWVCR